MSTKWKNHQEVSTVLSPWDITQPTHPLWEFNPGLMVICLFVWFLVLIIIKGGEKDY